MQFGTRERGSFLPSSLFSREAKEPLSNFMILATSRVTIVS